MAQFESSFPEFQRRQINVVFIAAQKLDGLFRGKKFMDGRLYPFPVLFDENRIVTRAYGVHHALGIDAFNIAKRSVFLVDGDGVVRWIAVSPHQMEAPGIEDILRAIESCDKC